ncbi:MAG: twin-arginine translocase subunit TatC [Thioalkalispiraceae bacterium]|jgi:sec-independent protein translocase protein TatC
MSDETTKQKANQEESPGQTFISHLIELRDRLLRVVAVMGVITIALMTVANDLYYYFSLPIQQYLPENTSMIAVGVISPIFTPLKLALIGAFFISIPYILYQAWGFVAPGLYQREKRLAIPLLISSIVLFYLGMAFAYAVVFPLVFQFTTSFVPTGIEYRPDIADYLNFSLKMFFAFGVAFEVPIATIILIAAGIADPDSLAKKRPYIIVAAFVLGMLLTPPDVISQIMLALPMWLLFEMGIIASKIMLKDRLARRQKEEQQYAAEAASATDDDLDDEFEQAIREEEEINKRDPLK